MKKLLITLTVFLMLVGCASQDEYVQPEVNSVYYEIFVGSFYDSDEDGMGDLEGVRQKLDYIQYDLGATGIWLMPISPSPTYHKYDVTDYKGVDPAYGSMEDFDNLVNEMNERNMDLILDFVLNHSSSQHPWFIKAKKAQLDGTCEITPECDFYNFSDTYKGRYHKINDTLYYEGGFWDQMPDLNLYNETVKQEILDSAKFWLDKGVKGFRLDATTHFFDDSHQDNIEFLAWFNDEVKSYKQDAYIVGEAWTGEGIVKDMYTSNTDSFFNFGVAQNTGTIVKAIRSQKGKPLAESISQYNQAIKEKNPNAIDAPFISNHDNNRSAGYLAKLEDQKLAASIYLLMPGNPFIYYGEEIAMKGSGRDENKRLPMNWSATDSKGMTSGPKDAEYTIKQSFDVAESLKDKDSLLNHYKEVIKVRNRFPEISRGIMKSLDLGHDALYAADYGNVIVIHNLSEDEVSFEFDVKSVVSVLGKFSKKGTINSLKGKSSIIIER